MKQNKQRIKTQVSKQEWGEERKEKGRMGKA